MNYINDLIKDKHEGLIFSDKNSKVYHSVGSDKSKFLGTAELKLFISHIEIDFHNPLQNIKLDFHKLKTINPQVSEILEVYYDNDAYRIVGEKKGISALKWEVKCHLAKLRT